MFETRGSDYMDLVKFLYSCGNFRDPYNVNFESHARSFFVCAINSLFGNGSVVLVKESCFDAYLMWIS